MAHVAPVKSIKECAMRPSDVARKLGVKPATVVRWIKVGVRGRKLKAIHLPCGYSITDVQLAEFLSNWNCNPVFIGSMDEGLERHGL
jgi:hypothetical protein